MGNNIKCIRRRISSGKRILVTSDIHGHLNHFTQILKKAEFSDDDLLIIIGDIIEKGPESLKTLRYLMDLYKRGNVIVLAGNVDYLRLRMIEGIDRNSADDFYNYLLSQQKWKGTSIFHEMASECDVAISSPEDILLSKDRIIEHFKSELDFLNSFPMILETQNYIFVHGGMPQKKLDCIDSFDVYSFLKYDRFMDTDLCFDKYIVVGHWPVCLYGSDKIQHNPIVNKRKKIISIDGGCGIKFDGQLNMIEIPDIDCDVDKIKTYSYDTLPVCKALEDQTGSADSVNILWTDNEITVLDIQDDFTYIEHVSTGRKLWIPSDYIYKDCHCDDYTTYILPVKKGDMLSVIHSTSKGHIVKKDGVTGWYYGNIEYTENL